MTQRFLSAVRRAGESIALVCRESVGSFLRNDGFSRSATLAYYCFLSLLPVLLLAVLVVSRVIRSSEGAIDMIQAMTAQMLPMADRAILGEVSALSSQRAWGVVAMVVLFWSATPLAAALRGAFQTIFRPPKGMAFFKAKLLDLAAVVVVLAMITALVVGKLYQAIATHYLPDRLTPLIVRLDTAMPLVFPVLLLLVVYRIFIPVRLKWRYLLAGCLCTSLLLAATGYVFALFLKYNPDYGVTFGSLKAIFLMFVWVFYSFAALLLGTEVMANIARRDALVFKWLFHSQPGKYRYRRLLDKFATIYESGQVVFLEGDPGGEMYYVIRGSVDLTRQGRLYRKMGVGEYFGEMAMLLDAPRTLTATAAEPETQLVRVERGNFEDVLRENPAIVLSLLREMASRLKAANDAIHEGGR